MADVFISYARPDQAKAGALAQALEGGGRSAWWDPQVAGGENHGQAVDRELDAAGAVVVAWSSAARDSLWVRAEANAAFDQGKLIQLNFDGTALPQPFGMVHALDMSLWSGGRGNSPWPHVESRIDEVRAGERSGHFVAGPEPALQGFGQVAILGWTAIAAALLAGLFTISAARGNISGELLGVVSLILLVLTVGLLIVSSYIFMRAMQASRR